MSFRKELLETVFNDNIIEEMHNRKIALVKEYIESIGMEWDSLTEAQVNEIFSRIFSKPSPQPPSQQTSIQQTPHKKDASPYLVQPDKLNKPEKNASLDKPIKPFKKTEYVPVGKKVSQSLLSKGLVTPDYLRNPHKGLHGKTRSNVLATMAELGSSALRSVPKAQTTGREGYLATKTGARQGYISMGLLGLKTLAGKGSVTVRKLAGARQRHVVGSKLSGVVKDIHQRLTSPIKSGPIYASYEQRVDNFFSEEETTKRVENLLKKHTKNIKQDKEADGCDAKFDICKTLSGERQDTNTIEINPKNKNINKDIDDE